MATIDPNPTVTPAWAKLVDTTEDFFASLPFHTRVTVEVVTHDTPPAATLQGHPMRADMSQEMNRQVIGVGDVYFRCLEGNVPIILSTWTV
jgi:hypothetical protein